MHVLIGGQLIKTVPSSPNAEDLATVKMRGGPPARPGRRPRHPPRPKPTRCRAARWSRSTTMVDGNGVADLAEPPGQDRLRRRARGRVTPRLDGHLIHVISGGVLAKTLPSPIPPADRATLRGARIAAVHAAAARSRAGQRAAQGPPRRRHHGHPPAAARRSPLRREDRHRPGRGHPLPRHLRRLREFLCTPATEQRPVTRWKTQIHARKAEGLSSIS